MIDADWLEANPLPAFAADGDKESRGRVMVMGGSAETAGAVILAGVAALRVGAGKLRLVTVPAAVVACSVAVPEARVLGCLAVARRLRSLAERCQAVLLGPGMLQGRMVREALDSLLDLSGPLVLDALALRVVKPALLKARRGPTVLTPHAGELAELGGGRPGADCARQLAEQTGAVVACKGSQTWIAAPDGRVAENRIGHVGLATSGSGDVLAGAVTGLCARGADPFVATAWAVYLHARASELLGPPGFLAGELAARFPGLLQRQTEKAERRER